MAIKYIPPEKSASSVLEKKIAEGSGNPYMPPEEAVPVKAPSGTRVFFAQRVDADIVARFRKLKGSVGKNLEAAMLAYMEGKNV